MRNFFLPIISVVLSGAAYADAEVGTAPLPEWNDSLQIEEFSKDRSGEFQFGIAYLLSDRQTKKTTVGFDYIHRLAYRVIDRSGLESAAQITAMLDPSNEDLSFNFIRVIRDGEVTDRLADAEITMLRQEEGLASSLIDGNVTALIQLEDIRIGDVIDYSVSGSIESKLWPDDYFHVANVEWSAPLAQMRFELQVPEDIEVNFEGIATDIEPDVTLEGGWKSYKLHVFDRDPIRIEENIPRDWTQSGFVVFTTMSSWADVVEWANPLYVFDEPLPKDFASRLDVIAANYSRPQDRALHALRLVQEDIRYLGIEVALGSHVPRSPEVTLERGYGDCKDKSVLLVSALQHLGIDAAPALASLAIGEMLPKLPPSIGMFDHVIVELEIEGQKYWVDPTLSHQGGLAENLANLEYGYVLPIRGGQTDLVKLHDPMPTLPTIEIRESFEIPDTGDVGMTLAVEYVYRGASANSIRLTIVGLGQEGLARNFLDFYVANYEGLSESKPLTIADDLDGNELTVTAEYSIDADALQQSDYQKELPVFATAIQGVLPRQVEANRTAPLRLPFGSNTRHTIRVSKPGRKFGLPKDKQEILGGISYARKFDDDDGVFVLDFALVVSDKVAPLESIKAVTDLADEIAKDTDLTVRLNSSVPKLSRELGLDIELDPTMDGAITRIDQLIDDEEYIDALTWLNRLVTEHTDATKVRGFLQLKRARVLVELRRRKAALTAFREAFELYLPPKADGYFKFMNLLRTEGLNSEIVPVMTQMFEHHPESVKTLNMDWVRRLSFDLHEFDLADEAGKLALAIASAVHEIELEDAEKYKWPILIAVEDLAEQGDAVEAAQYLPYLRGPDVFARLLTSKTTAAIWKDVEEKAGKDLSSAISDYVTYTYVEANRSPDDYMALTEHLKALRVAGKYQEATQFADLFINNWARIEAVGEDAYWFVNATAHVLSDAGRKDDALALMSRLVNLGIQDNSALISMAINRAGTLMHWEEFETALEAVEELEGLEENYASDYGRMWIYAVKACSLHQLGRTEEALSVLNEKILPIADENTAAHTKLLLCLDRLDDAADLFVDRLQDPDESRGLIVIFSEFIEPDTMPPFLAELHRRADIAKNREDVQEAFDKIGRAISINGAGSYWSAF